MQQHLMQIQPMLAAYYPNNITTDHIQQYLDENKLLILKIVESQNSGRLSECAENQSRLQQNLMYLAAIADAQPQPPTVHAQFPSGGIMQTGGGHYMPHQQAQPQSLMASRASMLYAQQPFSSLQQQQAMHGQVGMSSGGNTGFNILQSEASSAGRGGAFGARAFPDFARVSSVEGMHGGGKAMEGGCKQDIGSAVGSPEGRGGSSGGQCGDEN
ncbi:GRF1-interacting factor 1-like [Hibiscus syriacus]|uniref:GRF1-interacting factor 1-like n=1 Tax=Hibiscus syriacus TaxID=106335 RepID=UPI001922F1A5|nr:GRF1-interacting factor 1-like [Hibiscus syriacus]